MSTPDRRSESSTERPVEAEGVAGGASALQSQTHDRSSPQFTVRALLTGILLACIFSACNIYVGLRIGIVMNMAITAALVAFGGWTLARAVTGVRRFGMLENNINQTAAAAGASVASAGLVAPIPALAMLTGQTLEWYTLALWLFSVCLVGITVAIGLRRQMILVDKLPFAVGIATAQTLRELYAEGAAALKRVLTLTASAAAASAMVLINEVGLVRRFAVDASIRGLSSASLTFGLEPTLLMYGVGGLVGFRACASMVVGAVLAWGVLTPRLIESGQLRLEVSEPVAALPAGVDLPAEPRGYARYDANSRQLVWKGRMSPEERGALLSLTSDEAFREAIAKLHVRSQLSLAEPLAALPAGVVLPADGPVSYDVDGRRLVARGGLDRRRYAQLAALSEDADYQAALERLFGYFQYTTSTWLQFSDRLPDWPRHLVVPRACAGVLRHDVGRQVLVAVRPVTAEAADALSAAARDVGRRWPEERGAAERVVAAVARLYGSAAEPRLPSSYAVPAELADVVSFDAATQTFRARGILTGEDLELLRAAVPKALPGYGDYAATIGALVARTRFSPAQPEFRSVVTWLLWPGVSIMVVASLVAFGFSWRSIAATFWGRRGGAASASEDTGEVSRRWFVISLLAALILSVVLQMCFFSIAWWAAATGVLLSFVLAIVAGRVSGETAITPVGAMGKVTQLLFGAICPGRVEPNLMAANVTGGAASQCAELLHDLKCGHLIGATPRLLVWAQILGAAAGSVAGALVYLILIPNPQQQLLTDAWAAPGVAAWKAVAELFKIGFQAIPSGTPTAIVIGAVAAVVLTVVEKTVPPKLRPYMLSPASAGLGFVIPAYTCLTMFSGALVVMVLSRLFKNWSGRYVITLCAGIVAGESLTGVGLAIWKVVQG